MCLPPCDCAGDPTQQYNCIAGSNSPCGDGKSLIKINVHPLQPPVGLTLGYPGAIQGVISHELGHDLLNCATLPGCHVPNNSSNPDIMREGVFTPATIDFGPQDIGFSGAFVGTGIENAQRRRSLNWPLPATSGSNWGFVDFTPSQWGGTELAHGYLWWGPRRTSFFVADTSSVVGLDVDQAIGAFPTPMGLTRQRAAVAYDRDHAIWWLAAVNFADNTILLFRSFDRVAWTSLGALSRPSGTSSFAARTRFPVALAYEPSSDRVVVAWTNFAPGIWTNCTGFQSLCSHELHTALIPWDATTATVSAANFTRWEQPSNASVASAACVGAPAVACGSPDSSGRNCEILCVGFTPDRAVGYARFRSTMSGIDTRFGPATLGGWTDDQISFSTTSAGYLVAAVSGVDNGVWLNSKPGVGGPWTGWQRISGSLVTMKGPLLRPLPENAYDLVTFPN